VYVVCRRHTSSSFVVRRMSYVCTSYVVVVRRTSSSYDIRRRRRTYVAVVVVRTSLSSSYVAVVCRRHWRRGRCRVFIIHRSLMCECCVQLRLPHVSLDVSQVDFGRSNLHNVLQQVNFLSITLHYTYIFSTCIPVFTIFDSNLLGLCFDKTAFKWLTTPVLCEYTTLWNRTSKLWLNNSTVQPYLVRGHNVQTYVSHNCANSQC